MFDGHLHALTERICERYTVEVQAAGAVVDRQHVEEDDEQSKEPTSDEETRDDADQFAVLVVLAEREVGQQGEREQETHDEADQVGVVVDERQQANDEEHEQEQEEPSESSQRVQQDLVVLYDLGEEAGENAKL